MKKSFNFNFDLQIVKGSPLSVKKNASVDLILMYKNQEKTVTEEILVYDTPGMVSHTYWRNSLTIFRILIFQPTLWFVWLNSKIKIKSKIPTQYWKINSYRSIALSNFIFIGIVISKTRWKYPLITLYEWWSHPIHFDPRISRRSISIPKREKIRLKGCTDYSKN